MDQIIRDLKRCAKQNEADAKASAGWSRPLHDGGAAAVAAEQRRMIKILIAYRDGREKQDATA